MPQPTSSLASGDDDIETKKREAKYGKLRARLDAEISIGVTCTLVAGFALTLIVEAGGMIPALQWIFVCSLCLCAACCLFVVLFTGHVYWAGTHVLSATMNGRREVDVFRRFWKLPHLRRARTACRTLLQYVIIMFLTAIIALVQDRADNWALTSAVIVIFAVPVLIGVKLQHEMFRYVARCLSYCFSSTHHRIFSVHSNIHTHTDLPPLFSFDFTKNRVNFKRCARPTRRQFVRK